jgi:hypothetical protein
MSLVAHAKEELTRAGLFDRDSDYKGMIGEAVLELVEKFAEQGHSGFSARLVLDIFQRVASFEALTPITCDPSEWNYINDIRSEPLWQNRRDSTLFSLDGGKTYYSVEDMRSLTWIYNKMPLFIRIKWPKKMHTSAPAIVFP